MGSRRGSRRRRRSGSAGSEQAEATAPEPAAESPTAAAADRSSGYGKAALLLALLLGMLLERVAAGVLPTEAADIFHLVVAVAIAFLVARWYRGFMRRTLGQARENRAASARKRR